MMLGIGLVGTVTGKIAAALVERRIREGRGLGEARMSGHLVVVGWKSDMLEFVGRLLEQPGLAPGRVVLVNAAGEAANEELRQRFPGLGYVHGDTVDPSVLQRAERRARPGASWSSRTSRSARSDQERDARTVMTVMNDREPGARGLHLRRGARTARSCEHLRLAHCDEIVLSRDHARSMLLSASAATGMTPLVDGLLAPGSGLATVPVPERFVGRPFGELAEHLRREGGRLAIGLIENTGHALDDQARGAARGADDRGRRRSCSTTCGRSASIVPNRPVLNPPQGYPVPPPRARRRDRRGARSALVSAARAPCGARRLPAVRGPATPRRSTTWRGRLPRSGTCAGRRSSARASRATASSCIVEGRVRTEKRTPSGRLVDGALPREGRRLRRAVAARPRAALGDRRRRDGLHAAGDRPRALPRLRRPPPARRPAGHAPARRAARRRGCGARTRTW